LNLPNNPGLAFDFTANSCAWLPKESIKKIAKNRIFFTGYSWV
jgi:hypothetical protein